MTLKVQKFRALRLSTAFGLGACGIFGLCDRVYGLRFRLDDFEGSEV